jgi:hypothetical protein
MSAHAVRTLGVKAAVRGDGRRATAEEACSKRNRWASAQTQGLRVHDGCLFEVVCQRRQSGCGRRSTAGLYLQLRTAGWNCMGRMPLQRPWSLLNHGDLACACSEGGRRPRALLDRCQALWLPAVMPATCLWPSDELSVSPDRAESCGRSPTAQTPSVLQPGPLAHARLPFHQSRRATGWVAPPPR